MDNKVVVVDRSDRKPEGLKDAQKRMEIIALDQVDIMSTPKGRRFVWRLLKRLGYTDPIQEINAKAYGLAAKQEVALDLARELKKNCRDLFYQMEVENDGL